MPYFAWQNNVPLIGRLKASMRGSVTEIMGMYFFETPLLEVKIIFSLRNNFHDLLGVIIVYR